ncbi:MAG: hypothetical protein IPP72_06535 [Chitinophagaceae bacterium]|nr:hypothetical protein [Chitinophagaceae bacterium]
MTRNWYAVYTRPYKEKKVASILSRKGIENYCPVIFLSIMDHQQKNKACALFLVRLYLCK